MALTATLSPRRLEADPSQVRQPHLPKPNGLFSRLKHVGHKSTPNAKNGAPGTVYQPICRSDVLDILLALEGYGVHVVYAGAGEGETAVALTLGTGEAEVEVHEEPLRVNGEIEALLILADAHFPHAGAHLLREARAKELGIPVIAMILQGLTGSAVQDLSVLVHATGVLSIAPVDDVVLQPSCREDLPSMLAVVMEKVERRVNAMQLEVERRVKALHLEAEERRVPCSPGADARRGERRSDVSRTVPEPTRAEERRAEPPTPRGVELKPSEGQQMKESGMNGGKPGSQDARKEQRRHHSSQTSMWDECRLLRRLRHPNVVGVQDVVDAQLSRPLKGSGSPNLRRAIANAGGRLPMQRAQVIFWQLASGVAYCHEQRIAHRNLKPESVMVFEGDGVKLANFSLAVKLGNLCRDKCGTMPFVAPEILAGKQYDASASDVWSMGIVLLEMLCGINKLPRMLQWGSTSSPSSGQARELEAFFQTPDKALVSMQEDLGKLEDGLEELIPGMLAVDPARRWTAAGSGSWRWAQMGASVVPHSLASLANFVREDKEEQDAELNGGTGGTPPLPLFEAS